MMQTTSVRVHLFHGTRLLATVEGTMGTPDPYYTLDDGSVVQSITYLSVVHIDGTPGLDVQVVPKTTGSTPARRPTQPRSGRTDHRA